MTVTNDKSRLDCLRCWCCKKKPTKRHHETVVTAIAIKPLDLSSINHSRLNSNENISLEEALNWNGRYTVKDYKNTSEPLQVIIETIDQVQVNQGNDK